jgi:hypothetical protein
MKRFLLIAGDHYYPRQGTGDWIGCFETEEEAEEHMNFLNEGDQYDWHLIVNLIDWSARHSLPCD